MSLAVAVAVVLWIGVTAYAVLGGADFGSGFWDLTAGGSRRGARPRALVDLAIGSVWEANHVWLIFCLVVTWTAFDLAFGMIVRTLFVPLIIAAIGIIFRGAGFAFRHVTTTFQARRAYGAFFALSSVVVPFMFGCVAGAIASGRVAEDSPDGTLSTWLNPTSLLGGVLAVVTCAFLAATFLVREADERGDQELVRYFARRAIASGIAAGVVAIVGVFVLAADTDRLFDRLTGVALPLVIVSGVAGVGAMVTITRSRHAIARLLAVGAVVMVIWGWGVAQYPYLLPDTVTIEDAAAPSGTLWALVIAVVLVVLIVGPALYLLLHLTEEEVFDTDELGDLARENQPETVAGYQG